MAERIAATHRRRSTFIIATASGLLAAALYLCVGFRGDRVLLNFWFTHFAGPADSDYVIVRLGEDAYDYLGLYWAQKLPRDIRSKLLTRIWSFSPSSVILDGRLPEFTERDDDLVRKSHIARLEPSLEPSLLSGKSTVYKTALSLASPSGRDQSFASRVIYFYRPLAFPEVSVQTLFDGDQVQSILQGKKVIVSRMLYPYGPFPGVPVEPDVYNTPVSHTGLGTHDIWISYVIATVLRNTETGARLRELPKGVGAITCAFLVFILTIVIFRVSVLSAIVAPIGGVLVWYAVLHAALIFGVILPGFSLVLALPAVYFLVLLRLGAETEEQEKQRRAGMEVTASGLTVGHVILAGFVFLSVLWAEGAVDFGVEDPTVVVNTAHQM